jgi:hypothetical protein
VRCSALPSFPFPDIRKVICLGLGTTLLPGSVPCFQDVGDNVYATDTCCMAYGLWQWKRKVYVKDWSRAL